MNLSNLDGIFVLVLFRTDGVYRYENTMKGFTSPMFRSIQYLLRTAVSMVLLLIAVTVSKEYLGAQ